MMMTVHGLRPRRSGWLPALLVAHACAAAFGDDIDIARQRLEPLGARATFSLDDAGRLTEIVIQDGSGMTAADIEAFGGLAELRKLQIFNCRSLDDVMVAGLGHLGKLDTLALTNSSLTDASVEMIAKAFPNLVDLDLSSNANMSGAALKWIAGLGKLERLALAQGRFNDLNTRRLAKLKELQFLDLRGNMEAGDMTLGVAAGLPKLRALKHRSTTVTDEGLERLAASTSLESLLMQDFGITNASGPHLAKLGTLKSLEIFRCQGFGSDGVLALKGMPITRLTLRDLPDVGNSALELVEHLPELHRLYLHELASVGDDGLKRLTGARNLEVLDIWSLPSMTDASLVVIASLPALKELSIRETGMTEAALTSIAALPGLQSLTFKNNGRLSAETVRKLSTRTWKKLDLGDAKP